MRLGQCAEAMSAVRLQANCAELLGQPGGPAAKVRGLAGGDQARDGGLRGAVGVVDVEVVDTQNLVIREPLHQQRRRRVEPGAAGTIKRRSCIEEHARADGKPTLPTLIQRLKQWVPSFARVLAVRRALIGALDTRLRSIRPHSSAGPTQGNAVDAPEGALGIRSRPDGLEVQPRQRRQTRGVGFRAAGGEALQGGLGAEAAADDGVGAEGRGHAARHPSRGICWSDLVDAQGTPPS
mmetsp:Transcript_83191/g.269332  ORF Transcript_83191/g.269332 Transcript_83191/m.269332 type:complete len:237 (+) Transcript_83191:596-1306(+)